MDSDLGPEQIAPGIEELLFDGGAGKTGFENITVIPWEDVCAALCFSYEKEQSLDHKIHKNIDILNTPMIDIKVGVIDDEDDSF